MFNPLLEKSTLPYEAIPFNLITIEHFLPAVEAGLQEARAAYDTIRALPKEQWSFESVIEAMENTDRTLSHALTVFYNLYSANSTDEMTPLALQISQMSVEFNSDISCDPKLFESVRYLYEQRTTLGLTREQERVLERTYTSFTRNGALLSEEDKAKLRALDIELQRLSLTFSNNVLKDTKAYSLHITNLDDIDGLPESAVETAKHEAEKRGLEGWIITLDMPSYLPFMKYCKNRELRKELSLASSSRAHSGATDNRPLILQIVRLRQQRAELLGYASHAHFMLEDRMAGTPDKVDNLHEQVFQIAKPFAEKELQELADYAKNHDGIEQLMPWDTAFYTELLRHSKYFYDDRTLRPYFPLEQTLEGMFTIANKLYDISLQKLDYIPTYAEGIQVFEAKDNATGKHLGLLYFDLFPRAGKKQGAWCSQLRRQAKVDGIDYRPHATIVANFTPPTANKQALLSYPEVRTLFHEFGHSLHVLFSDCTYETVATTSVSWDFVELPSKFMENWIRHKDALSLFAKHYKTGEPMPEEIMDNVLQSVYFHEGMHSIRQTSLGTLDMAWHSPAGAQATSVEEFEESVTERFRLLPKADDYAFSPHFLHIFQGGYAAGYYSYKWSEVLEADAFELFLETGIFNKDSAERFRRFILSRGGSEDARTLYELFRGKKPGLEPLFRRAGFLPTETTT